MSVQSVPVQWILLNENLLSPVKYARISLSDWDPALRKIKCACPEFELTLVVDQVERMWNPLFTFEN